MFLSFCHLVLEGLLTVEKNGFSTMKTKCWVLGFPFPTWNAYTLEETDIERLGFGKH
jgi:hypothetical protein